MSKKAFSFLAITIFFSSFHFAFADVIINEIQLNPTSGRFIELYNSGDSSVDLTGWYIQRKTQTGSSFTSLVSNTNFENKTITAHGFFVVSYASLPSSSIVVSGMTLTDSNTIQIKNSAGDVVDKIGWGTANDCVVICAPSPSDGTSIQKQDDNSWLISTPTPGAANQATATNSTGPVGGAGLVDSSDDTSSTNTTNTQTKNQTTGSGKIATHIVAKKLVFVGVPFSLSANALGSEGEVLHFGKYFWNFGDGDSKDVDLSDNQNFTHTYLYPGDYIVSLDYYENHYSDTPDASDQMTIKAIPADIVISKVGDDKDFFIELTNNTDYDADLSNWILVSDNKSFSLPRDTILKSKNKMMISSKVTNLSVEDKDSLKLLTPEQETVFDYSAPSTPAAPAQIVVADTIPAKISVSNDKNQNDNIAEEIPTENLPDAPIVALQNTTDSTNNSSHTIIFIISFLLILAGAGGVYFIRHKKVISDAGDDFEILDE